MCPGKYTIDSNLLNNVTILFCLLQVFVNMMKISVLVFIFLLSAGIKGSVLIEEPKAESSVSCIKTLALHNTTRQEFAHAVAHGIRSLYLESIRYDFYDIIAITEFVQQFIEVDKLFGCNLEINEKSFLLHFSKIQQLIKTVQQRTI
jgi:hypothetical protein